MQGSDLKKLKRRIDKWRATRAYRQSAMPEKLWNEAVQLCQTYPLNLVRRELRIEGTKLKAKLKGINTFGESNGDTAKARFVSLDMPVFEDIDPMCEWIRPDGTQLRIKVKASQIQQIVASFLGSSI